MPDFGIFRGFNDKLFGDKLYAGQLPTQLGIIGSQEVTDLTPFEFTINTAIAGTSGVGKFQLPLVSSLPLNAVVDWGDGSIDTITTFNQAETLHTYPSAGTYTIKITGDLNGWRFANGGDRLKMLNVFNWGALNISVDSGFFGCTNLTCSATDAPVITSTSLSQYFRNCTNFNGAIGNWNISTVNNTFLTFGGTDLFNQPIGLWNVSNVTNMTAMFEFATNFNQNIGSWNVSKVTNMSSMFLSATNFNQNIGLWNVSSVTTFVSMFRNATAFNNGGLDSIKNWVIRTASAVNMSGMFGGDNTTISCKFDQYIGDWNTSAVTSMAGMFQNNTLFNQDIGLWNVSSVTTFFSMFNDATAFNNGGLDSIKNWVIRTASAVDMSSMFRGSNTTLSCKFNQPIGSWNISAVTNLGFMFSGNTAFNQPIGSWNTSSVTSMAGMFRSTSFNEDISIWITSSVTSMIEMFNGATAFNQDIGSWNVSKVTNMSSMFASATEFNQNIGLWNVSNVTNFMNFMAGKTNLNYSAANLASIYNGWSQLTLKPNISITFNTIDYCDTAEANKQSIVTNFGWNIIDGNAVPC